jgi:hypothetical protein
VGINRLNLCLDSNPRSVSVQGAAMRGKQLAITAAVALAVVVAYDQYKIKKG